jgi:protein BCP1
MFQEIQVDFEGRNPIDSDFHGIKQLLGQLFPKAHINLTEMTDVIIKQNFVGSVIKQCDLDYDDSSDEDIDMEDAGGTVFGVATAINITNKTEECVKQFRSFILEKAEKNAKEADLKTIKDILGNGGKPTGLIINERFINIPAQIAVPTLDSLQNEIRRANEKKMPFNFGYYVMLVKYYHREAQKKKAAEIYYTNPEEEALVGEGLATFDYTVEQETTTGLAGNWLEDDTELKPYRKVIFLDGKKLPEYVKKISDFVSA